MKKIGKVSFLIAGLFMLALASWRLVYGGWHPAMWVPFTIVIAFSAIGFYNEGSTLARFFTMRTTKHGMNMGVLILLALVCLVSLNFLAVRYDKKLDLTREHLNSLSDQSMKAVEGLKEDVELVLLYRKEQQEENIQRNVRDIAQMYQSVSKRISFHAYSALTRPDLAQKYEFAGGSWGLFAVSTSRHLRIMQPTEEEITKTLIKMGRDKKKVLYFVAGHGEREIDSRRAETASDLKEDLSSIYDVRPLTLFQVGNKVPADAEIVAIIGPQQQFLDVELEAVRSYARQGGHLMIALDPGMHHNLAQLTKTLGVEFKNNYVLDERAKYNNTTSIALGTDFSKTSDITKSFKPGMITTFLLASALEKAPDAPAALTYDPIVKTDSTPVSGTSIDPEHVKVDGHGPFILVEGVHGTLPPGPGKDAPAKDAAAKEFSAVIFGDSDIFSNALLPNNLNRDLVMNSFEYLSRDKDLISIRPKSPKGTKMDLTEENFTILVLLYCFLSIGLFGAGGAVWWRRRTA
jgi:ABC-type uncharacterized transport system involved in gliding motility auxiliary subunit